MKRYFVRLAAFAALMGLAAGLLAGCGSQSPSDVARQFSQNLNNRDFSAAYDMLASSSPIRSVSRDDFIKNADQSFPQGASIDGFNVTEEDINADHATVKWAATEKVPGRPDNPVNSSWDMLMENGQWKILQ